MSEPLYSLDFLIGTLVNHGKLPASSFAEPVVIKAMNGIVAEIERLSAIEQAASALIKCKGRYHAEQNTSALAKALGIELPQQSENDPEPFGYFKAEPFGWTDCSEDDEGAIALYEHPPMQNHFPDATKMASGNQVNDINVVELNRPSAIELQDAEIGIPEPVTELINPA